QTYDNDRTLPYKKEKTPRGTRRASPHSLYKRAKQQQKNNHGNRLRLSKQLNPASHMHYPFCFAWSMKACIVLSSSHLPSSVPRNEIATSLAPGSPVSSTFLVFTVKVPSAFVTKAASFASPTIALTASCFTVSATFEPISFRSSML